VRLSVAALRRLDAGTVKEVDLHRIVADEFATDEPPFRRMQGIVTRAQTAGFKLPPASVMAVKALLLAEGVALRLDRSFRPHEALAPAMRSLLGSPRAVGSRMRPRQLRRRAATARRIQGR
jgi:hypothetical protein